MDNNRENIKHNKQKLVLLSDLWGKEKSDWLIYYTSVLEKYFNVTYYDICELASINKTNYTEENIHQQFINGGIEKAIESILQKETENIHILGFSLGGTIAWKASIKGLKTKNIFAISATRLRYETQKPNANIELFYGDEDTFKPNNIWFENLELKENLFKNESHLLYTKKEIADVICKTIIEQIIANK